MNGASFAEYTASITPTKTGNQLTHKSAIPSKSHFRLHGSYWIPVTVFIVDCLRKEYIFSGEAVMYLRNAEGMQSHSSNKHLWNQPFHSKNSICFLLTQVLPEKFALPVPGIKLEYVPLMVSGLTAAISLDKVQLFHRNKKPHFFHFIEVIQDIDFVYFRLEKWNLEKLFWLQVDTNFIPLKVPQAITIPYQLHRSRKYTFCHLLFQLLLVAQGNSQWVLSVA